MINITELTNKSIISKPFLRWAGGKSWFQKYLSDTKELKFNNYHEPFLGGGATFFSLKPTGISYLSDLNIELVNTYIAIRDNVEDVILKLKTFHNTEKDYYEIRQNEYELIADKAAQFIFLNQTSFNGIYRVNLKGAYNVPYGFRNKPFIDEKLLKDVSFVLQRATLQASDFDIVKKNIALGDLVFLDPPYTVSHNNNGFIKYNEKIFSLEDQYRLSELISFIKEKNAYYILTNAAHNKIKEIFEKKDNLYEVSRASLIGGTNAHRGGISELIFTNLNLL